MTRAREDIRETKVTRGIVVTASASAIPLNGLVLINTGNVDDVDNAKLFIKLANSYSYLTDLSGASGIQGEKGAKGDTPVRGKDYWTAADKAEIKSYVDEAILGGEW